MYKWEQISGLFIFLSFTITIFSYFIEPSLFIFSGFFIWTAVLLILKSTGNLKLLLVLLFFSICFFCFAYFKDFDIDYKRAILVNQYLVVLLIGVGFLRLIATPKNTKIKKLPTGKGAILKTYFGVHLFGAVINFSSIILVADKLYKKRPLTKMQVMVLTRSFSSDAYWSPFFVAFAAASTYASSMSTSLVLIGGLTLAIFAFIITYLDLLDSEKYNMDEFKGYPIHFETLYIPIFLAIAVLCTNKYFPEFKVIILIPLFSLILTAIVLPIKEGPIKAYPKLLSHIFEELPRMKNELALFIVAGLFGVGISTVLVGYNIYLPIDKLDGFNASVLLLILIVLAFIGIHPIISIAIIGNWMADLNHTMLAATFLMSWGTSVSTSPFSGLNLMMNARYKIKTIELFKLNFPYVIKMYGVCVIILFTIAYYLGI